MRPLDGIRVLDLSSVIFGPLASQTLADFGADVIKIEPPEGDSTRQTGPATEPGMSAIFLGANHSKQSVVLDLKQAAAQAALQDLIATADVLMHSMRPQKLAALGLAPEALRARHPRLVFANLLGFLPGPYQGRPAYDDVIQAMSGLADLMTRQTGETRYLPTIAADKTCAHVAAHAILAALMQRERQGQGCVVDVPMFESMVHFNLVEPYTDSHWRRFFQAVGTPHWAEDPRFVDMAARTQHIAALLETVSTLVAQHDTAHWLALCEALEIPAAPVSRLEDLADDPHLQATGFFETIHDPHMGTLRFTGTPVRFNGERHPVSLPPRLGQHTRAQLQAAGLSASQIDALLAQGAAFAADAPASKDTP